jgi:uncharacterized membrane protein YdbT with pleckstrin-like domain
MPNDAGAGSGAHERAVARGEITNWVLIWPLIWTGASFGLLAWLTLPWLAFALAFRRTTSFAVSDRRIVHRTGVLARKTAELELAAIDSVRIEQTIVGRWFDYGAIVATAPDLTEKRFGSLGGLQALKRAIEAEIAGGAAQLRAA